jgi:hypothetical protein
METDLKMVEARNILGRLAAAVVHSSQASFLSQSSGNYWRIKSLRAVGKRDDLRNFRFLPTITAANLPRKCFQFHLLLKLIIFK